jgi:hypothetical protein
MRIANPTDLRGGGAMKKQIAIAGILALALWGCGQVDSQALIEEATYTEALSEGDGEGLTGVPEADEDGVVDEEAEASVDDEAQLSDTCSLEAIRARVLARYDRNGDGKLGPAERAALAEDLGPYPALRYRWARHFRLQRMKWVYDANEDGVLEQTERAALRADLEARCEARRAVLLEHFDADQSGTLDASEWAAARDALRARIQARVQAVLDEFDANGNGQLDAGEKLQLAAAVRARLQALREEIKAQYDADGNGVLDEAERAQLREFLRAHIRGEYFGDDGV